VKKDDLLSALQSADEHLKKADAEIRAKLNAEREVMIPVGVQSAVGVGSLSATSNVTEIAGNVITVAAGLLVKR
jgi:hypothetical protein